MIPAKSFNSVELVSKQNIWLQLLGSSGENYLFALSQELKNKCWDTYSKKEFLWEMVRLIRWLKVCYPLEVSETLLYKDLITKLVFVLRKSSSALMYSTQDLPHPGGRVPRYSYSLPLCRMWPAVTVTFLLKSLRHTVDEDICIVKPLL